jgi:hypothetical protein
LALQHPSSALVEVEYGGEDEDEEVRQRTSKDEGSV